MFSVDKIWMENSPCINGGKRLSIFLRVIIIVSDNCGAEYFSSRIKISFCYVECKAGRGLRKPYSKQGRMVVQALVEKKQKSSRKVFDYTTNLTTRVNELYLCLREVVLHRLIRLKSGIIDTTIFLLN